MTGTGTRARRHVAAAAVLAAATLLLLAGGLRAAPPASPTAAEEAEAVAWSAVRQLRADLRLSNDDLAAMACSEGQAGTVLSALVAWHGVNRADLAARRAAVPGPHFPFAL